MNIGVLGLRTARGVKASGNIPHVSRQLPYSPSVERVDG